MSLSEKKLNIKSIILITILLPVFVILISSVAIYITAKSVQPGTTIDAALLSEETVSLPESPKEAFELLEKSISSAVNSGTIRYKDSTGVNVSELSCDNEHIGELLSFTAGSLGSNIAALFESAETKYGEDASVLLTLLPDNEPDSFTASSENGVTTVELIYTKVYGNMYFIGADTAAIKSFSKENEKVFSSINEKMIPEHIKYTLKLDEKRDTVTLFTIERTYNYSSNIAFVNTLYAMGSTPLSFKIALTRSFELWTAGIVIEEDTMQLDKNGYNTLTVTPYTEAELSAEEFTLTFTSSDESIAVVDENGQVSAVGLSAEPAVITVELKYLGKTFTDTCTVYVCEPVTAINLDSSALTLKKGEKHTLTTQLKPEDATVTKLGFISSDPSVATVSENGEIVAKGEGTATITIYSVQSLVAAECTVTVTK